MFLTGRAREISEPRRPRDPCKFPTGQLALLALVRLAEPIALTSILPYAWKLVLHFHICQQSNASFYSGILISAFALAESLTGMWWGGVSDKVGRKPVLLFGCLGTVASLLLVGFAPNFWVALFGRALGGLLNGNIGVIQTMVGELVTLPEHEPRAYAIMPMIWAIGTIAGPVIGGCFAEPSQNFPSTFSPDGLFGRFPYLLPNLICASLLFVAIVVGYFMIEETHPDLQQQGSQPVHNNRDTASVKTPLLVASEAGQQPAQLETSSYGTFSASETGTHEAILSTPDKLQETRPEISICSCFSWRVIMLVAALGIFTYHSMTYDVLISIFLEDPRVASISSQQGHNYDALAGGLGLSMTNVGLILAVNGCIALFVQIVVFPLAASWLGVWKLLIVTTLGHPLAYSIVPYLVFLPQGLLYPGIYTCLTIRNLFSIIAYPVLLILIKEASPGPSSLGKINGLAASVGAASRTMASPIAGLLYGVGSQLHFTPLAWWASALVAGAGVFQLFFVTRQKKRENRLRALNRFPSREEIKSGFAGDMIKITVEEFDDFSSDDEGSVGRND